MSDKVLQDPAARIAELERQQEIISDISFSCGAYWNRLDKVVCDQIIDKIGGSRELHQRFVEWAAEFDDWWEELSEESGERHNYIGEVDDFAFKKMNAMIAEIRLDG